MWTSLVAILLFVAFESSIARLPPPININQLDYAAGREAVPKMREEDIPLKCGAWKKMDCNDWENNYVMIETPGYPAKYQNKVKRWKRKFHDYPKNWGVSECYLSGGRGID